MGEVETLRAQLVEAENKLAEAQEVIRAIQSGDVDAVVVSGRQGEQIFTLKGAEYAYRVLVEAMNEGAATLAADGTVLYCNQRLSDLLEIPMERIIGGPAVQLIGEEGRNKFEALIGYALSGDPAKCEIELHTLEGRRIPVYLSLREMKGDEPTALCMVVTDLTQQKKWDELLAAEEILRKQAELLKLSFDAIIVWRWGGSIESWNVGAELLYGYPESEALGRVTHDLLATVFPIPWPEIEAELLEKGFWQGELRHRAKDGREIVVSARKQIIKDAGGAECVLEINRDITDRKRTEKALIQSEKLASVGRMASTIAHEINNPLETIGNVIYLAMTDPDSSPQAKAYLEIAVEELDRVTHITRQTLAFHRENKKPSLIDLRECVDGLLKLFAPRMKARGIILEKRYAEVEPILATGGEVQQVVSNLLSNSMDAMSPQGKIQLRISRAIGRDGSKGVRFTIADTGSGIPPESLKKIFEAFYTTKEVVGTGLGLWVTKQIVEKHGATIRVRSKEGIGTVFSIVFPQERDKAKCPDADR
jgi:PAS domain S-box-containing protein